MDAQKNVGGRMPTSGESSYGIRLGDLCQSGLREVRADAARKGLRFALSMSCDPPAFIADEACLRKVTVGMLRVALGLARAGTVWLRASLAPTEPSLRLSVSWAGGADLPHDGAWLVDAIAMVRDWLAVAGGALVGDCETGSEAWLAATVPVRICRDSEPGGRSLQRADPASAPGSGPPRILVADDDEDSAVAAIDFLGTHGYEAHHARDGGAAVALARALRPALILMDIQMPNIDGLTAIREIRADPTLSATPILAVTALAMPGDAERCTAAGADAYIPKPVGLRVLLGAIEAYLSGRLA